MIIYIGQKGTTVGRLAFPATEPRVVHTKDLHTHYIGRPSIFGNPFVLGKHGTREQVIRQFEDYARKSEAVLDAIKQLPANAVLGCFCKPLACHGDVIVKLWKEMHK